MQKKIVSYIIKTTADGLIYVKSSYVNHIRRPNAIEGAKVLGKPLVINSEHVVFLSYNTEGSVAFYMTNGFEIALKVLHEEAEEALNCAKSRKEKVIR